MYTEPNTYDIDLDVVTASNEMRIVKKEVLLAEKLCKAYNEYYKSAPNCSAPCRDFIGANDEVLIAIIHSYASRIGIVSVFTHRPTLLKTIRAKASTY